jgi:hypothetical protein
MVVRLMKLEATSRVVWQIGEWRGRDTPLKGNIKQSIDVTALKCE